MISCHHPRQTQDREQPLGRPRVWVRASATIEHPSVAFGAPEKVRGIVAVTEFLEVRFLRLVDRTVSELGWWVQVVVKVQLVHCPVTRGDEDFAGLQASRVSL
eukprot:c20582_g4_i1.p2 GENE.c20582_g4_i1~~c20582_g4_i1.p2  ORF type:complete len:103 (-),score=10.35 c20582_g4_i1:348-656(-)